MSRPILVSACLLGLNTRYNRIRKRNDQLLELLQRLGLTPVPVCPEQLAGLPTPRPATRFASGDGTTMLTGHGALVDSRGEDVTQAFSDGAEQTLLTAKLAGCRMAILKERSPSCGVRQIYLGNQLVPGSGVAAARLRRAGLQVFSDEELEKLEAVLTAAEATEGSHGE